MTIKKKICYVAYMCIGRILPSSVSKIQIGQVAIRRVLVKNFIKFAGGGINIERMASIS